MPSSSELSERIVLLVSTLDEVVQMLQQGKQAAKHSSAWGVGDYSDDRYSFSVTVTLSDGTMVRGETDYNECIHCIQGFVEVIKEKRETFKTKLELVLFIVSAINSSYEYAPYSTRKMAWGNLKNILQQHPVLKDEGYFK